MKTKNDRRTAEERVGVLTQAFLTAYNSGDAEAVASCYTENGVYLPSHHPAAIGRAAIESHQRRTLEQLRPEFTVMPEETLEAGNLILQRGSYIVRFTAESGEEIEDAGKYVIVCEEDANGELKLRWDIDNSNTPLE